MSGRWWVGFVLAGLALAGTAGTAHAQRGTVVGTVRDAATRQPLAQAPEYGIEIGTGGIEVHLVAAPRAAMTRGAA